MSCQLLKQLLVKVFWTLTTSTLFLVKQPTDNMQQSLFLITPIFSRSLIKLSLKNRQSKAVCFGDNNTALLWFYYGWFLDNVTASLCLSNHALKSTRLLVRQRR